MDVDSPMPTAQGGAGAGGQPIQQQQPAQAKPFVPFPPPIFAPPGLPSTGGFTFGAPQQPQPFAPQPQPFVPQPSAPGTAAFAAASPAIPSATSSTAGPLPGGTAAPAPASSAVQRLKKRRERQGERISLRMHHTSGRWTNFNTPNHASFRHILHTYARSHGLAEAALDASTLTFQNRALNLDSTPYAEGMSSGAQVFWSMGLPDAEDDELSKMLAHGVHVEGFFESTGMLPEFGVEEPAGYVYDRYGDEDDDDYDDYYDDEEEDEDELW